MSAETSLTKQQNVRNWLRRKVLAAWYWLHVRCPGVPHPQQRRGAEHRKQRDPEDNRATHPGDASDLDTICAWAVEYYTPSHIPALKARLKALGFDKNQMFSRGLVTDQISDQRERSGLGGWSILGSISSPDNAMKYIDTVGRLPPDIRYVRLRVDFVSPSLTAIVGCFFLKDAARKTIISSIKRDYVSQFKSLGRAYTVLGPRELKRDAVDELRLGLRQQIQSWYKYNIPGLLTATNLELFPIIDFNLLKKFGDPAQFRDVLGISEPNALESSDWSGIKLDIRPYGKLGKHFHAVMHGAQEKMVDIDIKDYGSDAESYAFKFDNKMSRFIVYWGLLSVLDFFRSRISRIRDARLGLSSKNAALAIAQLQKMNLESVDASSVCSELMHADKPGLIFPGECADFARRDNKDKTKLHKFMDLILRTVSERAQEVAALDARMNTYAVQQGALLVTAQNLSLQRRVGVLTLLAALLTAISAWQPSAQIAAQVSCSWKGGHLVESSTPQCQLRTKPTHGAGRKPDMHHTVQS